MVEKFFEFPEKVYENEAKSYILHTPPFYPFVNFLYTT